MQNDGYDVYRYWLNRSRESDIDLDKEEARREVEIGLTRTAAYQKDALRNGELQPIVAKRTKTNICEITIIPGDNMYIGDLIEVFNEKWLCTSLYVDEYGIKYGEIWLCNHKFNFQDHSNKIITKDAIIDDGSYSKSGDKAIPIVDGTYKCYMSLDAESKSLYVDKRLAIDTILDKNGMPILEVGKIKWFDQKTKNFGEGSHLLYFTLADDIYNKEKDNLDFMLCDYIPTSTNDGNIGSSTDEPTDGYLVISGRDSIRIGTSRTYKVIAVGSDGNTVDVPQEIEWSIEGNLNITIEPDGSACIVQVPLKDALIGTTILIQCDDKSKKFKVANKRVAVISIG